MAPTGEVEPLPPRKRATKSPTPNKTHTGPPKQPTPKRENARTGATSENRAAFDRQTAGKKQTQGFPRFEVEPEAQPPWAKAEIEAEAGEAGEVSELSETAVNELFKEAEEAETTVFTAENVPARTPCRFLQDVASVFDPQRPEPEGIPAPFTPDMPVTAAAASSPDSTRGPQLVVRAARPTYVPESQVRPAKRKRGGKRARIRKLGAKHTTSLEFFGTMPLGQLVQWCSDNGLIPPNPVDTACRECGVGKIMVKRIHEGASNRENAWFLCSGTIACGHRVSVLDWLAMEEI